MALTAEALAALLAVQEFSGTTEPTATLPLPRNSFRSVHAPSFPLTTAVCSPPCSPGPTSMGSQHWFCRGESSPFQQRARFTQQIELSPSLSIPPETVCTGRLCPVHSIKRHSFLHEERLWKTAFLKAADKCWTRVSGWRLANLD